MILSRAKPAIQTPKDGELSGPGGPGSAGSKKQLPKLEDFLSKRVPTVLVLASCWSYRSEICDIIRSTGLLTVLNVLEDRAKITNGNMLLLDQEQQDFFRTICDVFLMIKDIIL